MSRLFKIFLSLLTGDESQMHSSENTVELETDVIIGGCVAE